MKQYKLHYIYCPLMLQAAFVNMTKVFSSTLLPVGLGFLASPVLLSVLSVLSVLLAVKVNTALTTLIGKQNYNY